MNVEAQLVIGGVIDGVLAERHVAHRQIIEVLPVCLFKTGKGNIGVLIKLSGNAPSQIVQLYAVQLRRRQRIRQEAEKVADAHGRFQHGPRLEIHILHRLIHGLDDRGAGIVGVEDRGTGGFVFLRGQQFLQLGVFFRPLGVILVKHPGNAAPANIAGENLLFFRRGKAALRLDLLQGTDSRHIVLIFRFFAANTQVIIGDLEVMAFPARLAGSWRRGRNHLPTVNLHLFRLRFGGRRGRYGIIRAQNGDACFGNKVPHGLDGPLEIGIGRIQNFQADNIMLRVYAVDFYTLSVHRQFHAYGDFISGLHPLTVCRHLRNGVFLTSLGFLYKFPHKGNRL